MSSTSRTNMWLERLANSYEFVPRNAQQLQQATEMDSQAYQPVPQRHHVSGHSMGAEHPPTAHGHALSTQYSQYNQGQQMPNHHQSGQFVHNQHTPVQTLPGQYGPPQAQQPNPQGYDVSGLPMEANLPLPAQVQLIPDNYSQGQYVQNQQAPAPTLQGQYELPLMQPLDGQCPPFQQMPDHYQPAQYYRGQQIPDYNPQEEYVHNQQVPLQMLPGQYGAPQAQPLALQYPPFQQMPPQYQPVPQPHAGNLPGDYGQTSQDQIVTAHNPQAQWYQGPCPQIQEVPAQYMPEQYPQHQPQNAYQTVPYPQQNMQVPPRQDQFVQMPHQEGQDTPVQSPQLFYQPVESTPMIQHLNVHNVPISQNQMQDGAIQGASAEQNPSGITPSSVIPTNVSLSNVNPADLIPAEMTTAVINTPAMDTPAMDTPAMDTTAMDTTAMDTTAMDTTAMDTTAMDTTAMDTTAMDTTAMDTTATSTPASTTPASTTPASTTPASTTPASTTPASTTPASTTPASTTPANTTPASTTPASTTPASTTPASTTPASTTLARASPASTTPIIDTPASTTPAIGTPAISTPENVAPAKVLLSHVNPADLIPAEMTPASVVSADLTPDMPITQRAPMRDSATQTEDVNLAEQNPSGMTPVSTIPADLIPAAENTPANEVPADLTPIRAAQVDETAVLVLAKMTTPVINTTAIHIPSITTPASTTPAMDTPAIDTPAIDTPAISTPASSTPAISIPANVALAKVPLSHVNSADLIPAKMTPASTVSANLTQDMPLTRGAPMEDTKTKTEDVPREMASAEQNPSGETLTSTIPADLIPTKTSPANVAPTHVAQDKVSLSKVNPAKMTPASTVSANLTQDMPLTRGAPMKDTETETEAKQHPSGKIPASTIPADLIPAVERTPANEVPADLTPARATQVNHAQVKKIAAIETLANDAPAKHPPAMDTVAKMTAGKIAPMKDTPARLIPANMTAANEAPIKDHLQKAAPPTEVPVCSTPANNTLVERTQAEHSAAKRTAGKSAPIRHVQAQQANMIPRKDAPPNCHKDASLNKATAYTTTNKHVPTKHSPTERTQAEHITAKYCPAKSRPITNAPVRTNANTRVLWKMFPRTNSQEKRGSDELDLDALFSGVEPVFLPNFGMVTCAEYKKDKQKYHRAFLQHQKSLLDLIKLKGELAEPVEEDTTLTKNAQVDNFVVQKTPFRDALCKNVRKPQQPTFIWYANSSDQEWTSSSSSSSTNPKDELIDVPEFGKMTRSAYEQCMKIFRMYEKKLLNEDVKSSDTPQCSIPVAFVTTAQSRDAHKSYTMTSMLENLFVGAEQVNLPGFGIVTFDEYKKDPKRYFKALLQHQENLLDSIKNNGETTKPATAKFQRVPKHKSFNKSMLTDKQREAAAYVAQLEVEAFNVAAAKQPRLNMDTDLNESTIPNDVTTADLIPAKKTPANATGTSAKHTPTWNTRATHAQAKQAPKKSIPVAVSSADQQKAPECSSQHKKTESLPNTADASFENFALDVLFVGGDPVDLPVFGEVSCADYKKDKQKYNQALLQHQQALLDSTRRKGVPTKPVEEEFKIVSKSPVKTMLTQKQRKAVRSAEHDAAFAAQSGMEALNDAAGSKHTSLDKDVDLKEFTNPTNVTPADLAPAKTTPARTTLVNKTVVQDNVISTRGTRAKLNQTKDSSLNNNQRDVVQLTKKEVLSATYAAQLGVEALNDAAAKHTALNKDAHFEETTNPTKVTPADLIPAKTCLVDKTVVKGNVISIRGTRAKLNQAKDFQLNNNQRDVVQLTKKEVLSAKYAAQLGVEALNDAAAKHTALNKDAHFEETTNPTKVTPADLIPANTCLVDKTVVKALNDAAAKHTGLNKDDMSEAINRKSTSSATQRSKSDPKKRKKSVKSKESIDEVLDEAAFYNMTVKLDQYIKYRRNIRQSNSIPTCYFISTDLQNLENSLIAHSAKFTKPLGEAEKSAKDFFCSIVNDNLPTMKLTGGLAEAERRTLTQFYMLLASCDDEILIIDCMWLTNAVVTDESNTATYLWFYHLLCCNDKRPTLTYEDKVNEYEAALSLMKGRMHKYLEMRQKMKSEKFEPPQKAEESEQYVLERKLITNSLKEEVITDSSIKIIKVMCNIITNRLTEWKIPENRRATLSEFYGYLSGLSEPSLLTDMRTLHVTMKDEPAKSPYYVWTYYCIYMLPEVKINTQDV